MKQTSFEDYAVKGVRASTAFFFTTQKSLILYMFFVCFLSVLL